MTVNRFASILIIIIAVVFILVSIKEILIPFILALIIWFIIKEVQKLTKQLRIGKSSLPTWLAGLMSFLVIFAVLGVVTSLLASNIRGITEVLPTYESNLKEVRVMIDAELGIDIMSKLREVSDDFDFAKIVSAILNSLTSLLGNAFLVVIYVAFLMLEQRFFIRKLNALYIDKDKREKTMEILEQVDASLSRYVNLKTIVSVVTGVLSYVVLSIIGVDFAFFWAFLIFVLNYIPTVGSLIATLFPTIIAAIEFGDLKQGLWVLLSVGAIQVIVGNIIEPRVMGNSLNISSLVVILSLAFWGSIWGVIGMVLSVPITVMMVIAFSQFPATKGISILLSEKGTIDKH